MGFFRRFVVLNLLNALILNISHANEVEIIQKENKSYIRLANGSLVEVQKAIPVTEDEPIAEVKPATRTEASLPALRVPVKNEAKLTLDQETITSFPIESFDFSELEKDEDYVQNNNSLGAGSILVAIGVYALKRLSYLRQHPGVKHSNEIQREINRLDGFVKRMDALRVKLNIETKIVNNRVVLFFKNGRSPKSQISRLRTEIAGLELEWKKEALAFDRLEEKIDAEFLKRRQQTFLDLDKEYNALKERERTLRNTDTKSLISEEAAEEAKMSDSLLESAEKNHRSTVQEATELATAHQKILAALEGEANLGRLEIHPLAVENRELITDTQALAGRYRSLKFQAHTSATPETFKDEIEKVQLELEKARELAKSAVTESFERDLSEIKARQLQTKKRAQEAAQRKDKAEKSIQAQIADYDKMKAKELERLRGEIEDRRGTIEFLRDMAFKNGTAIASLPHRVHRGTGHLNPIFGPENQETKLYRDLDLARSRLELASHTSAAESLQKEAEALEEIRKLSVQINQKEAERLLPRVEKMKGSNYWLTLLRKEALARIKKKYKEFHSEALDTNESFMKILAGDNQSLSPADAKIVRDLVKETTSDTYSELYNGKKPKNPWYVAENISADHKDDLYRITQKLSRIAEAGDEAEETRQLAEAKKEMATEHAELRYVAAKDVDGRVSDPGQNRSMAEAATRTAIAKNKPRSFGAALSGCLLKLRHQAAIF